MANKKKIKYSAEQARRRNIEKAKQRAEDAKRKAWWQKNGKKVAIITAAAVIVLALLVVFCKYNFGPGGSIPNFFGKLIGVEDSWIVGNAAEDRATPRYFKLGEYQAPEGYEKSYFAAHSDELVQDQYYSDASGEKVIQDIYLSHVQGLTGEDQLANLSMYTMNLENSGAQKGTIAGQEADYMYIVFDQDDVSGEGTASASLCIYFPTPYDAVVSAMISSRTVPEAEVPSMETMLAEAETMLAGLTLVK